jgi:hypothetical protein
MEKKLIWYNLRKTRKGTKMTNHYREINDVNNEGSGDMYPKGGNMLHNSTSISK